MFQLKFTKITIAALLSSLALTTFAQTPQISATESSINTFSSISQSIPISSLVTNSSALTNLSQSSSSISKVSSSSEISVSSIDEVVPEGFKIPEPAKIDPKIEKIIISCIREKFNIPKKDIEIPYYSRTAGTNLKLDTKELVDYGYVRVKESKSRDVRNSNSYKFNFHP